MYNTYLTQLRALTSDMAKSGKDIEQFYVIYANVRFDVIYDISKIPFELLIGAINHSWACTLEISRGFATYMSNNDFYSLCDILNLKPGKEYFTSFMFLNHIASKAPAKCSKQVVDPSHLSRFRNKEVKTSDEPDKIYFVGWNNHQKDKRKAHNFDKTELFFGKRVADYCRTNNISSRWTNKKYESCNASYPWNMNHEIQI